MQYVFTSIELITETLLVVLHETVQIQVLNKLDNNVQKSLECYKSRSSRQCHEVNSAVARDNFN